MFMIYGMLRALLNKPTEISVKKFLKHRDFNGNEAIRQSIAFNLSLLTVQTVVEWE